jgi:hypothetical protein
MKKKLFILLSLILFGVSFTAQAYDFAVANTNTCITEDSIFFRITSSVAPYTVEVTNPDNEYFAYVSYKGDISIPSTVEHNGITYAVTRIGSYAFKDTEVTRVSTNFNITSIGNSAFTDCRFLNHHTILTPVTEVGVAAFEGCTSLTSIYVNTDNQYYASDNGVLYNKQKDTLIVCPGGLTGTFTVPNYVTTIGFDAFGECIHLTSIIIPNTVTSIMGIAFAGCTSLTSCPLPNSITEIPYFAFFNCSSLTSYTIPDYITSIRGSAFGGTGLTSLTCLATTPPVLEDAYVFFGVPDTIPVYVPCASLSAYQSAQFWSDFNLIQCLSLDDVASNEIKTTLYPNPTTDKAKLQFEGLNSQIDVMVYDNIGRLIQKHKINKGMDELDIDLSGYAKGIYNIRIVNETINQSKKLVVQ